jgi:hypothetical protein
MFAEGIVHECFKKLLANVWLCKLLAAVGKCLDSMKAHGYMDVYRSWLETAI